MNSLTMNTIKEAIKCLKKKEKISIILLYETYKKFLEGLHVINPKQEFYTLFGYRVYKADSVMEAYRLAYTLLEKEDKVYVADNNDLLILLKEFRKIFNGDMFI